MDNGQIILFQTQGGETKIEVRLSNETVWLTADQMAELFQRNKSTISRHIKNIYESGELEQNRTVAFFATVQNEGERTIERKIAYYNLDVIISVGYRVKSLRGTQFRKWALKILKEYMIKGFALDDERLKNPGGGNYWKELLDRIRDIRSSEKLCTDRCLIYMRQALTMIQRVRNQLLFSRWFRKSFTMRFTDILRRRLFMKGQTPKSLLWG